MKVTNNLVVTLDSFGNDAGELQQILEDLPHGTTFSLNYSPGDRPWESGTFTMKFTYDE